MSVKGKLLLVEDSAAQGAHIKGVLERLGYDVLWAKSGIEGMKLARSELPDMIILDVVMEGIDGFSVCRWLKMSSDTRDIPIIMLTVKGQVEDRIQGLNVGADDYLPKPFSDDELEARIFASLRVKASEMELKKRNVELQSMLQHVEALAVTDALTGLYNRRRFEDVLKREFAVTKRYDTPLSCLMIDVDHFKSINDTHGHDAGDIVLREIAQRLSQRLREVDLAARYGGEEFAILLPQTNKEGAVIVAERIMERIRREEFDFEGTSLCVTVSIGVAGNADIVGKSPESLVKAADAALYQAKEQGRNRVVAFRGDDIPPSSST